MNFEWLEEDVQSALEQYFEGGADSAGDYYGDKLQCAIPIVIDVIQLLVLPVLVAVISDFLLQNVAPWRMENSDALQKRVEALEEAARGKIQEQCSDNPALKGQAPQTIIRHVGIILMENDSLRIDRDHASLADIEKIVSFLESVKKDF